MSEKTQIANRLKLIEDRGHDGLDKQIETISKLTGRVEYLESEIKIAEDRHHSSLSQLETQVVLCKDREKQIHQLQEDVSLLSFFPSNYFKNMLVYFQSMYLLDSTLVFPSWALCTFWENIFTYYLF